MPTSPAHTAPPALVPLRPTEPDDAAVLPRPLTSFVGREREVLAVRTLLGRDDVRLVTLSGPGGVGKSRLALRVVESTGGFPDGVWFVALAPVRDPALVAPTIAQALGVRQVTESHQPVEHKIAAFLHNRRALLILDNFEHVLAAGALVTALLARCPALTVLVTSRVVLRVSGEHVFRVPPLALPTAARRELFSQAIETEAVQLFVERATASAADFVVTVDNAPAVVEICRRLDGLPLAIELAAARVSSLSPMLLLKRLDEGLQLLTGGPRDQPPRLRSLRDAIAWSYDLLEPDEQALLQQLAVFAGGWTLEAAEAVAVISSGSSVLDTLASLIDHSLVLQEPSPDGASRYGMLETVREFALEQLARSGEETAIRARHAAWCLRLAEECELAWFLPDGEAMLSRLEAEHPNLRVALAWFEQTGEGESSLRLAGALRAFWAIRGHSREGQAWLERALADDGQAPASARMKALGALTWILNQQGLATRALEIAEEGLTLARRGGDRQNTALCSLLAGVAVSKLGDLDRATAYFEEALGLLERLDEPVWPRIAASTTFSLLGNVAIHRGDIARAAICYTEALDRQRALGYAPGTSHVIASHPIAGLGDVARAAGDDCRALEHYQEALGLAWRNRDMRAVAYALGGVAGALAAMEQCGPAARLFGASEALHEAIGYPFAMETFDRQRAFGLPEPWAREGESFGVARLLRQALGDQAVSVRRRVCDAATAAVAWAEGRHLPIEHAISEALTLTISPPDTAALSLDAPTHHSLTRREQEVLRLLVEGRSNRAIADALSISERTAENHVLHILTKLGLESRTAAATHAVRHGLV